MGQMSGLIATNGKELDALKQLGDRNYFDFKISRGKAPQRVGDIAILLRKTDPKRTNTPSTSSPMTRPSRRKTRDSTNRFSSSYPKPASLMN